MNKQYLLIRMLGNDLPGLHGKNQTLENLEFTIKNEHMFENTDKVFVLNRIADPQKKQKIINLLECNNVKYIDLPFSMVEFNKLPNIKIDLNQYKNYDRANKAKLLKNHNLYLINNNGCRNFCIDYGKKNGYKWILPFDSNSFLTKNSFKNIINNIDENTEYIILPQKRLDNKGLTNMDILKINEKIINNLPTQEPQIAFKNTSKHYFNPLIPYGLSPKAELLKAFNVKGKWCAWTDFRFVNIKSRTFPNVKYKILSYVIRLSSHNKHNGVGNNWDNRWHGIYLLIQQIKHHILTP